MQTEEKPRKMGRALKWALGVSVALNLVFVGLIAGAALRHGDRDGPRKGNPSLHNYGAPFIRALPDDARQELHRTVRAQSGGMAKRSVRRALYQDVAALLRAETFDPDAIEAMFASQQATAMDIQFNAQTAWLALVSEMSLAQRRAVADRLIEVLERRKDKRKR